MLPKIHNKNDSTRLWNLQDTNETHHTGKLSFFSVQSCKTTAAKTVSLAAEKASFRRLFIEEQFPTSESSALGDSQPPFIAQNNVT